MDNIMQIHFRALTLICTLLFSQSLCASQVNELVIFNWSEYLDPKLIQIFEQRHNIKIREIYYRSDDERDKELVHRGGHGYDIVIVDGATIGAYHKRGWLAPIQAQQVPNIALIQARWMQAHPEVAGYAIPYFWGTAGIAYRADLIKEEVTSWMQLYRPKEELRGKIAMIENSADTIGMALKALGYSANSSNPQELQQAQQLLHQQKPYVSRYTYITLTENSDLVTGKIWMAMAYSGDVLMLQEYDPNIQYIVPQEGGNLWIDYLTVLDSSTKKELAYQFINFLNEPEHAAQLAQYVYYASPNQAAHKLLPEEFTSDMTIYPSAQELEKSEIYQKLPVRAMKTRNNIMTELLR